MRREGGDEAVSREGGDEAASREGGGEAVSREGALPAGALRPWQQRRAEGGWERSEALVAVWRADGRRSRRWKSVSLGSGAPPSGKQELTRLKAAASCGAAPCQAQVRDVLAVALPSPEARPMSR